MILRNSTNPEVRRAGVIYFPEYLCIFYRIFEVVLKGTEMVTNVCNKIIPFWELHQPFWRSPKWDINKWCRRGISHLVTFTHFVWIGMERLARIAPAPNAHRWTLEHYPDRCTSKLNPISDYPSRRETRKRASIKRGHREALRLGLRKGPSGPRGALHRVRGHQVVQGTGIVGCGAQVGLWLCLLSQIIMWHAHEKYWSCLLIVNFRCFLLAKFEECVLYYALIKHTFTYMLSGSSKTG